MLFRALAKGGLDVNTAMAATWRAATESILATTFATDICDRHLRPASAHASPRHLPTHQGHVIWPHIKAHSIKAPLSRPRHTCLLFLLFYNCVCRHQSQFRVLKVPGRTAGTNVPMTLLVNYACRREEHPPSRNAQVFSEYPREPVHGKWTVQQNPSATSAGSSELRNVQQRSGGNTSRRFPCWCPDSEAPESGPSEPPGYGLALATCAAAGTGRLGAGGYPA
ncbi:hypothetical protein METBIDRAFT_90978 [Metschnikowia bicuspidata var. bicuspidata NRRL YB-4993]|uniref:Uncharacterized protein n=1 Tax=Metschnikowia bicuspidata var. bicuspidata NRRL YB-4993 TaxID=869754 RepID=A0A1A0HFP9_9ASCO|nr:hypothetical protein METBIDRAFT_90978 [Metschnikowia bicuspidata var. bicuspidata NRRL YB-4993]OBA22722.1 hypothetical protein METBIDRAFT_90978 [Metschnikowia bicuspidata var. bicuspidata NRRL YB-4993]